MHACSSECSTSGREPARPSLGGNCWPPRHGHRTHLSHNLSNTSTAGRHGGTGRLPRSWLTRGSRGSRHGGSHALRASSQEQEDIRVQLRGDGSVGDQAYVFMGPIHNVLYSILHSSHGVWIERLVTCLQHIKNSRSQGSLGCILPSRSKTGYT